MRTVANRFRGELRIGEFEILATFTCAEALREGLDNDQARQRGMVAAIMGAHAEFGVRNPHHIA
ncbi:MAG: hypothetical protein U0790_19645 [Isosphaeraceae bacterium]